MRSDPIMVECDNCGAGHRWIPVEVEVELAAAKARIVELEARITVMTNDRLILEWYARDENYKRELRVFDGLDYDYVSPVDDDRGDRARKALGNFKPGEAAQ